MRVLQIIDSLDAGGAERVAVNVANILSHNKDFKSYLCATRKEGLLKNSIDKNVGYLCLNKKSTFDVSAIKKLRQFVKKNNIDILHAHSTSYFIATLVKLLVPNIKIVWHDHYGYRAFTNVRKSRVLQFCSRYFSSIICVNNNLKNWSKKYLKTANVTYLPNFAIQDTIKPTTILKGKNGERILHLANLRPQKDHLTLLKTFKELLLMYPEYTLHCVGKNFEDEYAAQTMKHVYDLGLNDHVFFYGSRKDITNILDQSAICVLSSNSEGLPIALLEYGLAQKPVIATDVGDCANVIDDGVNGVIVEKENPKLLAKELMHLIENTSVAEAYAKQLKTKVENQYSKEVYLRELIKIYKATIDA